MDWKNGQITLEQVVRRARFEWEGVNLSLPSNLTIVPNPIYPIRPGQVKKYPEWPPTRKFELVIQLIKGELSIEEASQKYSLPVRTIEEWIHISVRAIRDALQD
jgi:hypothetical protein